jgi:type I restriction enzyme M protein
MATTSLKRSERRAEHLLNDLLLSQGWDLRRPPVGDILFQHEYRNYPEMVEALAQSSKQGAGVGIPEAIIVDRDTHSPIAIIEVKVAAKSLAQALSEAQGYADAFWDAGWQPLAIGLAGTSDDEFSLNISKRVKRSWKPVTYDGYPIGWIPTRTDLARVANPSGPTEIRPSVPPIEVLAARAEEINQLLRESRIKDEFRPAVVAAIMLALWHSKGKIRRDPSGILRDINSECRDAFIAAGKADLAKSLRVDEANDKLKEKARRIATILERLNVTVLTAEHDYLGQLYEAFFRYTGGNTIGQYFTPRHITKMMADICEVTKDDIVLDPACGTGGFLIACMDRLLREDHLSRDQMVQLVKTHLIGFEDEPVTAALCVANMILRGDGSTGIHRADALSSSAYLPSVASVVLMNPPFPHAKTDTPPEEFVERGLFGLQNRGMLAAIVPQSLLVKREKQGWRDHMLKHNTLRGVISLPDELFQPFAAATTAILIMEKGVAHRADRDVFFARIENDGLKIKKGVRQPRLGSQIPPVIEAYFNKRSIARVCGWAPLDPEDTLWHPAAPHHVPTSALSMDEVAELKMSYSVKKGDITPLALRDIKKPIKLKQEKATIGSLFDIYGGQRELHNKEALVEGRSLVISASGTDYGAYGFFDFPNVLQPPFATVPGTGSIGQAFVQEWPCGVTDHCYILVAKKGVAVEMLYVACAAIRNELWRFSYGAQITPRRIAWFPVPVGEEVVELVKAHLASTRRIEAFALEEAEDDLDAAVALKRVEEMNDNPDLLLRGKLLEGKLGKWLAE